MRTLLFGWILLLATIAAADGTPMNSSSKRLTAERLVGSPSLDGTRLTGVKLSPDGSRVTYLKGKEDDFRQQDLWEFHLPSGEHRLLVDSNELLGGEREILSEVEKARRERQRIRGNGIVEYFWNEAGTALLFPLSGNLFYLPIGGQPVQLTDAQEADTDAKFSPLGNFVSFIRDRELYVVNLEGGEPVQLTSGATETRSHGMAEFIAQEELDRDTGYWWSPDESRIVFARVDEQKVRVLDRYELSEDGAVTTYQQRYPAAGTDNAIVTLGVVTVSDANIHWIDLAAVQFEYLARVVWQPDSSGVFIQTLTRDQKRLDLVRCDVADGSVRPLLHESAETWINLSHNLKPLNGRDQFLWTSERSGFNHIYRFQSDGTLLDSLTKGEWTVTQIEHVDQQRGWVYFTGFKDSTLEQHLYRVPLESDSQHPSHHAIQRVTQESGWHQVTMSRHDGARFLDQFSEPEVPPQLRVCDTDGGDVLHWVVQNPLDAEHPYFEFKSGHAPSRFGQLLAADGVTRLDYRMILPPDLDIKRPTKKYPAVLAPYGGPHGHSVRRAWSIDFNQLLARHGFVVLIVDNRGSYHRGVAFEAPIYRAMGTVEVDDQSAAARYLGALPFVDPDRIGFHGWSYGGYMTLMMMFKAPELIKVGIAGAPVTDWRLYDTAYTERYLGMPEDGDVYDQCSVFPYLSNLRGKLLLIHGMADDNVFFDNSVKLISRLQSMGQAFDLMTYPGQKHGFRTEPIQKHVAQLRLNYFLEHLGTAD